jgi:adenylate cyclase
MTDMPESKEKFWNKIKSRKIFQVIIVYATVSFIVVQIINNINQPLGLPVWTPTLIIIILIIGFPMAMILAWAYNINPNKIKDNEQNKPDQNEITSKIRSDKSIIVLPFDSYSPDPGQTYFSDGLTEEIIADLSRIDDLLVISRSSAMALKDTKKSVMEIGDQLKVRYLLEGSVRMMGDHIRVTAQLIDTLNDIHVWSDKYDDTIDNVVKIQERISDQIVKSLKVKLTPEEKNRESVFSQNNILALEFWYRAKQEIHKYTEESFNLAKSIIEDGLNTIGDNILLLWAMGYIHWFYVNMGIKLDPALLDKAEEFIEKIFKLYPESFYGYQLKGLVVYKRGDTKESIKYMKKALEIEPNNPEALDHLIWMYADTGKTEKSVGYITNMLKVDPLTAHNHWVVGLTYLTEGRYQESLHAFGKVNELIGGSFGKWGQVLCLLFDNKFENAQKIFESIPEEELSNDFLANFIKLHIYAFKGDYDNTINIISSLTELGKWDELVAWIIAQSYALINEKEKALYWYESAFNKGFFNYPFLVERDPGIKKFKSDPDFQFLLKKIKKEWGNFQG